MKQLQNIIIVFLLMFSLAEIGWSQCAGDVNCDGVVDGLDVSILAADFGTTGCGNCDNVIARVEELEEKVAVLEDLLLHFRRDENDIFIEGANLHIRNTDENGSTNTINGLGNLIVGYNELRGTGDDRNGSHNVVIGTKHNYSAYGGLVVGQNNEISGNYASVSGGHDSIASGTWSSVSGGSYNQASRANSSVSGGRDNTAAAESASISGGRYNSATGDYSSVSGGGSLYMGQGNRAEGAFSSVNGGILNYAQGEYSSVNGGASNYAIGRFSSVAGGQSANVNRESSSVVGDAGNVYVDNATVH